MKCKNLVYAFLVASFAIATGAQAFTMSVTPDAGQTCSYDTGRNMLTCSASSTPACVLTPSTASPTLTQNVTLTVTGCTGSYTFTGSNGCPVASGTTSPVTLTAPNTNFTVGPCTYTVAATGATNGQTSVTWSASPPPVTAPSGCTVSGGGTVNSGASVTLTASCSGGSAPTSWSWKVMTNGVGTALGVGSNPYVFTATGTGTYYVTATNSAGSSDSNQATVTVNSVVAPPPPTGSCPSGVVTVAGTPAVLGVGNGSFIMPGVSQGETVVFPFTMQGVGRLVYIKTAEYAALQNQRTIVLSTSPCGAPIDSHSTVTGSYATMYAVPTGSSSASYVTPLNADGTVYYATIYNRDGNGTPTCTDNNCGFIITFNGS